MSAQPSTVQLPAKAVSEDTDLLKPLTDLLSGLNLLPDKTALADAGKPSAFIGGPPDSVALIEAGGTALSKWWAAGLGASILGLWGGIRTWWDTAAPPVQGTVLWCASIATAAAVLALAYIIGSDLRGRAAAQVATIQARSNVADLMVRTSGRLFIPTPTASAEQLVALPAPLDVQYAHGNGDGRSGWRAIALQSNGDGSTRYLIAKAAMHKWVDAVDVQLD